MNLEIQTFVEQSDYYRDTVCQLAGMLPADDAALDLLIGETIAASDQTAFAFVVMAAFQANRPVPARHLARGTMLMPEKITLGVFACHMTGDIATPLTEALMNLRLPATELVSSAAYLAARWHQDNHTPKIPGAVVSAARLALRNKGLSEYDRGLLHAAALICNDPSLTALSLDVNHFKLGDPKIKFFDDSAKELAEQMLKIWKQPPLELLPAQPRHELATGNTMRRAVPKRGRNEPCHCGSGKKYKHCCISKDDETLHHSTSIAGVTEAEMRANPERYVTALELESHPSHEVARFDPRKLTPEMHEPFLANLCRAKLFDPLVAGFEIFGYRDKLNEAWEAVTIRIAQARRKDLVERMLKLLPEGKKHRLGAVEFYLADTDPARLVASLQEAGLTMLTEQADNLKGFSLTLMKSPLCALGILVGRGAIPVLPKAEASEVMDELLRTRDMLGLPPDDPISDIMDQRFLEAKAGEGKDAVALREAQSRLNEKIDEVNRYKQSVARLQTEVARREQLLAARPKTAAAPAHAPADDAALKELREKVAGLKSALKERHNERNALRRELQIAHTHLESFQHPAAPLAAAEPEPLDEEETWLLPQDAPEIQPVRLVEFPKGFQAVLEKLPRHVARATVIMAGRLAAGEPAAYVGALRLKATPKVMRQRIGSDYRLLFRLWPDHLEIMDLINRKDLERKIKSLG